MKKAQNYVLGKPSATPVAELIRKVAVCGIPAAPSSMRSAIKADPQLSKRPRLS